MKMPLVGALVQAIRNLSGQSGTRGAPASSQAQAPAPRAEQIAAQLEGSTLCRDYTVCTDNQALLGEGGQACAIRAHHKRDGKDYALKVFTKGPWGLAFQRTEVQALTHLQAVPNAVRYKEHGEHQGQAWLVETLAEGSPAFEQPPEALSLLVIQITIFRVCQALAEMHGVLRTHADIKIDNIHVAVKQRPADTAVTVLDFGTCHLHRNGTRVVRQLWEGTPMYAPPEHLKYLPIALCGFKVPTHPYAADSWGIGMLTAELLALPAALPMLCGGAFSLRSELRKWTRFHPTAAVESDAGAPDFWNVCPDPWYRHFIHGALHPDPSQRMTPAEMCLHPFLEPAMNAVIPELEQADWRFRMHQKRLRSPAAKSRGPEARLVVESALKHLHARILARTSPQLHAKHAAKLSSRRYKVSPDLCQDLGAIQAAIRAYRPHLVRCTNPTAAAAGHPAQSAPATAGVPSRHTPCPRQDARPLPGLQSERGSVDEPSISAAAGCAAGQRQQALRLSAWVNLDSHFDAPAADAAGPEQQAPLTPVEPESRSPPPTSSAGSSPMHGASQLEVQPEGPLRTAPAPTSPAELTDGAAQAQADTPAVTAVTDGPAKCSAGGQAAACPPEPESGPSQPKKGRARRWLQKKAGKPLRLFRRGLDAARRTCATAHLAGVFDD